MLHLMKLSLITVAMIGVKSLLSTHSSNLEWSGGPLHLECELTADLLMKTGQHVRENVIAVKAVSYKDKIYVLTPRLKHGVISTICEIVHGRRGPELQPYPDLRTHALADCAALQNAVDFHLDPLGILWILDSGIVETLESPRCMCQPKVVAINLYFQKITRHIDLSALVEPTSLLQNVIIDYGFGTKPYVYVSDASRGAVLVHAVGLSSGWTVLVCAPAAGMQLAVVRRSPAHATLLVARVPHPGILELDTANLQRRHTLTPLRVFGDHVAPVLILGTNPATHQVLLKYKDSAEVMSWNINEPFNTSTLQTVHSPAPGLAPTSATCDPWRPYLIILDSNYAESIQTNLPTYHRVTVMSKL